MGILIKNIDLPEKCSMCPLCRYIETADDHEAFYFCILEHWRESCTPTPMTLQEIQQFKLENCPLIRFTEEQDRLEDYIQFYKGCIDKLLTLYHIADANTLYEQGIKDGVALAAMHGSDATSQDLAESFFDGVEAGAKQAWQIAHDILSEKIPLKIFNPKPDSGNLFMFNQPFMRVLNIIREWENQHDS